jgi:hypothetical protein
VIDVRAAPQWRAVARASARFPPTASDFVLAGFVLLGPTRRGHAAPFDTENWIPR